MDTASSNLSTIQSFSVMSCIPQQLNRDKVLSMISSISRVEAFNIIQIVSNTGEYYRIGVAKVVDSESIYRLTSRRFLVGANQAIKFCQIPDQSRVVHHSFSQDIQLSLKFCPPERTFFHKVVEFVNKIGPSKLVTMKGQASQSELHFRVPAHFSLKEYSTELSLDIHGCPVSAQYTEESFSLDYFKHELSMIKELIGSSSTELPIEVSEKALFFRHQHKPLGAPIPRPEEHCPIEQPTRKVALFEKTYDIVEDDLSEAESEEDFEKSCRFERIFGPLEFESEEQDGICFFNKENDFGFFTEKSLFLSSPNSAERWQESEAFQKSGTLLQRSEKCPVGKRYPFGSDAHTHSSNGSNYQNLNCTNATARFKEVLSYSNRDLSFHRQDQAFAQSLTPKHFQPNQTTSPDKLKGQNSKQSKNESSDLANHKSQTSQRIRPSNKLRDDRTKGRAQEEHCSKKKGPGRQGPGILDRISPAAADLVQLNENFMPQIKEVWRRFWTIKNEIKKEKLIEEEAKKNSTGNKPTQRSYGHHLEHSGPRPTAANDRVSST